MVAEDACEGGGYGDGHSESNMGETTCGNELGKVDEQVMKRVMKSGSVLG